MKIFALYTDVTLTKQPKWLDGFVEKYQLHGLHVTLKQPCFIKEEDIPALKEKVELFVSKCDIGRLDVVFDEAVYNTDISGAIMLCARNAPRLIQLQQGLCGALQDYNSYVDPDTKAYEKNFRPHITIGDAIPQKEYQESLKFLKEEYACEGTLSSLVLSVVSAMTLEEITNPANKTTYHL